MLTDERLEEIRYDWAEYCHESTRTELFAEIDRLKGENEHFKKCHEQVSNELLRCERYRSVANRDIEKLKAQLAEAKELISEYRALIAIDSDWFTTNEANYYDGQDNQAEAWLKEVEG